MLGLLLIESGCANRVFPPAHPAHPANVYICDYGLHSSLLLPVGRGVYVEYFFGDWNWAVVGKTGPLDGLQAFFFSKKSVLGRRFIQVGEHESVPTTPDGPKTVTALVVDSEPCSALTKSLDERFKSHLDTLTIPSFWEMACVVDERHYSLFHNCNHATADYLRALGCRIDGYGFVSRFIKS